ncbi:MAG: hypothetical protein M3Q74_06400 [Pseudomonadota bacterium]|nr:hypothetical protein [Pseudomonadota bacterium]
MSAVRFGAFQPGAHDVEIEHAFARADDPAWGAEAVRGIRRRGHTPLVTVEPWTWPTDADLLAWGTVLGGGFPFVRFGHEPNLAPGHSYPWGSDPERYRREWARFRAAVPGARLVWCMNISYPGSRPMADYWPGAESVDVLGIDGYAWNGEPPAAVFRPSLAELRAFAPDKPAMVCETAFPAGKGQAAWARKLAGIAVAERIGAVVWFSQRKEMDWTLSAAARRAFARAVA